MDEDEPIDFFDEGNCQTCVDQENTTSRYCEKCKHNYGFNGSVDNYRRRRE